MVALRRGPPTGPGRRHVAALSACCWGPGAQPSGRPRLSLRSGVLWPPTLRCCLASRWGAVGAWWWGADATRRGTLEACGSRDLALLAGRAGGRAGGRGSRDPALSTQSTCRAVASTHALGHRGSHGAQGQGAVTRNAAKIRLENSKPGWVACVPRVCPHLCSHVSVVTAGAVDTPGRALGLEPLSGPGAQALPWGRGAGVWSTDGWGGAAVGRARQVTASGTCPPWTSRACPPHPRPSPALLEPLRYSPAGPRGSRVAVAFPVAEVYS